MQLLKLNSGEEGKEIAEIKFTADSKLAEANALVASIEEKSLQSEVKPATMIGGGGLEVGFRMEFEFGAARLHGTFFRCSVKAGWQR